MVSLWKKFAVALFAMALAFTAAAQQHGDKEYQPSVGQEGRDVIWVPTPNELIAKMLDMTKVTANDIVYDLGSGDGRTVIAAAKRGAQAVGVEFNPDMVALSNRSAKREGVTDKARFIQGDIFQTDFSKATVITLYLLPSLNLKLRPTILDMRPGTRVASHAFNMGEWEPDETAQVDGRTAYYWMVPAKVAGTWRVEGVGDLALKQEFQKIQGTLGGKPIINATLRGETIAFAADGRNYSGRVNGDRIEGSVSGAASGKWTAARTR
ncbi:MAG: class I SAM-dependent methyltransferase [Betaproteobacteria bacterium]|nr:class I SAM-dependent methyltransferase [Betaproteobacteria bacterium]